MEEYTLYSSYIGLLQFSSLGGCPRVNLSVKIRGTPLRKLFVVSKTCSAPHLPSLPVGGIKL